MTMYVLLLLNGRCYQQNLLAKYTPDNNILNILNSSCVDWRKPVFIINRLFILNVSHSIQILFGVTIITIVVLFNLLVSWSWCNFRHLNLALIILRRGMSRIHIHCFNHRSIIIILIIFLLLRRVI